MIKEEYHIDDMHMEHESDMWPCECCGELYPRIELDDMELDDGTWASDICDECYSRYKVPPKGLET